MNRTLRPTKLAQQIKEEQISFLLQDIETKDKQLAEIKKILQGAKSSYQNQNKLLKQYITNTKQQQQHQQQQYFRPK